MSILLIDTESSVNYFDDLLDFIYKVDDLFEPPLSERVNIEDYTSKLYKEAFIYVVIENKKIQAVCAYYCTPEKFDFAFLSFVASLKKGLGGLLIEQMIYKCREMEAKGIETQTWETNSKSLKMFKRYNFLEVDNVSNRNTHVNSTLLKLTFND
jgi:hypothetical protein